MGAKSVLDLSYNPPSSKLSGFLLAKKLCKEEEDTVLPKPKRPTMQFRVLSIFSVLLTSTIGRPRIESSNSNSNSISNSMSNINSNSDQTDRSSTKRPLSACEEAIYSCCSSQWSTFLQSGRCFEPNNCPGINFIVNPCFRLPSVINRI